MDPEIYLDLASTVHALAERLGQSGNLIDEMTALDLDKVEMILKDLAERNAIWASTLESSPSHRW